MSADERTIAVYEAKAADYAARFAADRPDRHLVGFIAALPKGAWVLDLGCGPADASAFMRAAGLIPDPVDAAPAMVALANARHAIGARLATFDEIEAQAAYDGIWANFSLLHAPRADLPRHLAALHRALTPGGLLHIGMKTGTGEGRDALDRFYTYVGRDELLGLLAAAGFTVTGTDEGIETGLAGTPDPWIIVRAHA
ncbi:class I SAM-dependent methyltransferase [Defluviimonas sp. D31]|uniref:class I SAM-dependent DNA methyltransferase n=1 Tax=Defluviimonas sp. D31 TaxID=3083253 RepID=UPI00296F5E44|nr:class I SAM-dependent methyltransferase [Defluviimonas sp. D31]MDW4550244.1 class I SAM-dependent methyltransferase [Defluviimonas sp. D31]